MSSDDLVMLSFEEAMPNTNFCEERTENILSLTKNNNNIYKEKLEKRPLMPAIIFGATRIQLKEEEEFPNGLDFLSDSFYQSPRTPLPQNLRIVLHKVSKYAKRETTTQTWPLEDVPYSKLANHWCSITFLEYMNQIGNVFRGLTTEIYIEGIHAHQDPRRMCLSQMINVENRMAARELVCQIGNGIHLKLQTKSVELVSKCSMPVFIQAPLFSMMYDRNVHVSTVYRLPPTGNLKIFDFDFFHSLLSSNSIMTRQDVESLEKLACVKLSFGKGFGKDYARATIEETPCWLHIVFIDPIRIIDHLLMQTPFDGTTVHSNT